MIAWEESGSGRPAVLVHGLTEDRRMWDRVVPLLEDGFRCVRLDLRGHGESSDADDYGALAMAADVATVVAEAGIDEPPLLVGHSLGAVVITAYAAQAPAQAVVNVDQPLRFGDFARQLQPLAAGLRGPDFAATLQVVFGALGVDRLPEPERTYASAKHDAARPEVVLGAWDLVLDTPPDELTATAEQLLGAVTVPYLTVLGGPADPDYAAWLTAHLPTATLEFWEGDGHYPHLVEAERFAARVRELAAG